MTPEEKEMHNINVKLKLELFEKLVERANENDTTVSHEVRQLIKREFKDND